MTSSCPDAFDIYRLHNSHSLYRSHIVPYENKKRDKIFVMTNIKFCVFGIPHFERDGQNIPFQRSKGLALMAYLVATRQAQSRDVLCDLFWSELNVENARGNLRRELSLLNDILPPDTLIANRTQVAYNPQSPLEVDLLTFWTHIQQSGTGSFRIQEGPIAALKAAVQLYRDDFLAGFAVDGSPAFDDWLYFEAESLRRAYAAALQALITWYSEKQQYAEAITYARQWVALDPLHELAQRQLISVLAWAGQAADALRQYQNFEELLRAELDVVPETETIKLYDAIRLRQFKAAPVRVDVPQLAHNLPAPVLPFVGRQTELNEIQQLFQKNDSRFVTLVAPGGMGKTRLALEVAQQIITTFTETAKIDWDVPGKGTLDGIYFVDLTPLVDSQNIVQTMAQTLAYNIQSDSRSPRQQILDYVSHRTLLLIFDNYEHLLDDALFMSDIFKAAPHIRLLVTSREPLNLQEEIVLRIGGMEVPEVAENGAMADVLQLLVNHARRVEPKFQLEASVMPSALTICRAVGGMPLGIMLATAWLDTLTLAEIAHEIQQSLDFLNTDTRNVVSRHRNIRAVFEPSWQRLTDADREIFMQLTVFRHGFTMQAAQRIVGVTLAQLARLVKKSLVQRDLNSGRYSIHELLRQYAQEHLQASGKSESIQTTHSRYYLEWLGHLKDDIQGRRQLGALDEIEADIDNVRSAWQWASQRHDFNLLNHALESFYNFFDMFSRHHEGVEILRQTVTQLGTTTNENQQFVVSRIQVRLNHFLINNLKTDLDGVLERIQQHWQLAQKRADKSEMAFVQGMFGWYYSYNTNTLPQALEAMEAAIAYARELNDNFWLPARLNMLYVLHKCLSELEANSQTDIMHYLQEAMHLQTLTGDGHGRIWTLRALGDFYFIQGQPEVAAQYLNEMQELAVRYRDHYALCQFHGDASTLHFYWGNFELAREHGTQLARLVSETGYQVFAENEEELRLLLKTVHEEGYEAVNIRPFYENVRGDYPEPFLACVLRDWNRAKSATSSIMQHSRNTRRVVYLSVVGLAAIVLANTGLPVEGVEILAYTLNQPRGHVGWLDEWYLVKRLREQLQTQLGDETYQAAWQRGTVLDDATVEQRILSRFAE
jgi:predicted ATPase/DNA-binding SARP family transcriptional activator